LQCIFFDSLDLWLLVLLSVFSQVRLLLVLWPKNLRIMRSNIYISCLVTFLLLTSFFEVFHYLKMDFHEEQTSFRWKSHFQT